jgi:hypothetical protein
MSSLTRSFLLFPVFLVATLPGCGSTIIDGDGPDDDDGECLAMPVCNDDEVEVPSCGDPAVPCREVSMCGSTIFCEFSEECFEGPYCPYGNEVEVCPEGSSCFEVTACGLTILCEDEIFCDGYPSCDEGDTEVEYCPTDVSCYTAEMCGYTITCIDNNYPEHGCPPSIPSVGDVCDPSAAPTGCNYPTGNGCFESWACQLADDSYYWEFIGGGCKDG